MIMKTKAYIPEIKNITISSKDHIFSMIYYSLFLSLLTTCVVLYVTVIAGQVRCEY